MLIIIILYAHRVLHTARHCAPYSREAGWQLTAALAPLVHGTWVVLVKLQSLIEIL